MAPTVRREPKRVRSARRRAAHHADRARKATTAVERYKAAEDALSSAVAHCRQPPRTARILREELVEHVRKVVERAEFSTNSIAHYEQKLAASGTELQRLGTTLMCLRGAIARLPATDSDRLYKHYTRHFDQEIRRITGSGGDR